MILVIAPWSSFWDRNFFAAVHPLLGTVFVSPYLRGAVSGVGVITVIAGLAELAGAFTTRREASAASSGQTLPFDR